MDAIHPPDVSSAIYRWWERVDEQIQILSDALAGRFPGSESPKTFQGVVQKLLADSERDDLYRFAANETTSDVTDRLLHEAWDKNRLMLTIAWSFSQGDGYRPDLDCAIGETIAALSTLFNRLPLAPSTFAGKKDVHLEPHVYEAGKAYLAHVVSLGMTNTAMRSRIVHAAECLTDGPYGEKPKLPHVDLTLNKVTLRGQSYDLDSDGALLVAKLTEAFPHWFSASTISSKPSRVLQGLPEPLQAIIVTEPGKGYRLRLP